MVGRAGAPLHDHLPAPSPRDRHLILQTWRGDHWAAAAAITEQTERAQREVRIADLRGPRWRSQGPARPVTQATRAHQQEN